MRFWTIIADILTRVNEFLKALNRKQLSHSFILFTFNTSWAELKGKSTATKLGLQNMQEMSCIFQVIGSVSVRGVKKNPSPESKCCFIGTNVQ